VAPDQARQLVVVTPEDRRPLGNIEFIARSEHTPHFNLAIITKDPHTEGPDPHTHREEDDSFLILEGEVTFTVEGEDVVAEAGTFVLVPPGIEHTFANRSDRPAKILNIHAPAGFDRRMLED
jgi:mannose-6-phosphate isomerase-like protein (cupin superfamily)